MTTPIATIVIPIAPYHTDLADRAIQSAKAQTVRVRVWEFLNTDSPAIIRNRPLTVETNTPFLVFLDADDTLEPTFVEECLRAYQKGKYVYTGWYAGTQKIIPPLCNPYAGASSPYFQNGHFHLVTTLYPTAAFRALGGFDETLPGHEDKDFYLKSARAGVCGVGIDKPLVHYSEHGERSNSFASRDDAAAIRQMVYERNGGEATIMGCCGVQRDPAPTGDPGQQQAGDVWAQTTWNGIRDESSADGTRRYRGGNGAFIWVDAATVAAKPRLFRAMPNAKDLTPDPAKVLEDAGLL